MERVMSVEDKIRKAEEIYYRRNFGNNEIKEKRFTEPKGKKDVKLLKKMFMQIIVCLFIYMVFYLIINNNYIFSQDFINKAREILSQDINITEIYSIISNKINEIMTPAEQQSEPQNEQIQTEETEQNPQPQEQQEPENIQENNENIGGAEEPVVEETPKPEVEANTQEPENQLTQMEQDANYIKSTISFIKPINGTISSMFGTRNPTTPTVPKNHTGTDIAAVIGTKIVSATNGTVVLTSSKGDFGNHLEIQINDVIILYAHCNKIYVNKGDEITQGQEIAEVGNTGNTTGPHLHFEVRYQNRLVDPQMILEL